MSYPTYIILLLLSFTQNIILAQTLSVNNSQLNFGVVYENSPDSLPLVISNNLGYDVQVSGIRFYDTYGQPPFSASRSLFTVADLASETLYVKFSPRHNIFHNSEMVIENNSHRGFVSVDLIGQGRYSMSYYDSSENKSEEDLKNSLKSITGTGYISLGYNVARDSMFMSIDNKARNGQGATLNTLECIYTGRLATGYTSRTYCQDTFNFNTEHTFPQGLFASLEPMKSDLHHLYPTDDNANNVRSSYPFGVVSSPTWQDGGSRYANSIFEPRNSQKGKSARAMFYFVIRYQNYSGFLTSQEGILRNWHAAYLPDSVEITRNNAIFSLQQNRNPFVDYPQFMDRIRSVSGTSIAAADYFVDLTEPQIDYGFVTSSSSHRYRYILVNHGNRDIQFSNFSLTPSSLFSFASGSGLNIILPPGEALAEEIDLTTAPSGVVTGSMAFNTTVPGQSLVTIPIHVDGASPAGIFEPEFAHGNIFPNPAEDKLYIRLLSPNPEISLFDMSGRKMNIQITSKESGLAAADLASLDAGIYIVSVQENISPVFYRVIRK